MLVRLATLTELDIGMGHAVGTRKGKNGAGTAARLTANESVGSFAASVVGHQCLD